MSMPIHNLSNRSIACEVNADRLNTDISVCQCSHIGVLGLGLLVHLLPRHRVQCVAIGIGVGKEFLFPVSCTLSAPLGADNLPNRSIHVHTLVAHKPALQEPLRNGQDMRLDILNIRLHSMVVK